jgi:hypothetical protein
MSLISFVSNRIMQRSNYVYTADYLNNRFVSAANEHANQQGMQNNIERTTKLRVGQLGIYLSTIITG